ncbi:MAG: hypothetical protein IKU57_00395, partial [Oscillospiraceae bacterium]|nr:hypothetical protein [Oscillospiraceae bacterium]
MNNNIYKRVLSLMLSLALLVSYALVPMKVWAEDANIQLTFNQVNDSGHWYFGSDKTEDDLGAAYDGFFYVPAEVDGKAVNVWLQHYGDGNLIVYGHVILDPSTGNPVTPIESFKITAGAQLIPTGNPPSKAQVTGRNAFVFAKDFEVVKKNGLWMAVESVDLSFEKVNNGHWYLATNKTVAELGETYSGQFWKVAADVDGKAV